MSVFLQQLPALIGVVVGAVGSYLAITRGDRARFRQERDVRWEERRLTVYGDYARSLKRTVSLGYRIASHLGNDPHPHPLSPQDAVGPLTEAAEARDPVWEQLRMIGTPEVVRCARAWMLMVLEMETFLRAGTHDPAAWADWLERQRAVRDRYYDAVRAELVLPAGAESHLPALPPARDARTD